MSTEQTNANMYTVGTNMNGKKAVWKKGDSNGAVCSMTGRDEDEDNAHLIAELFNVKMETGLTTRQLLDRLNIYESKFIEISALLERFTNGGIQIAKSISDNPLGGGFKQINPLYSENKELKEQRDELLKLPEEDWCPHIKTLPELLRRAAEVLKLKADQNEARSTLVEPLINAAERIEKYSTKQD